MFILIQLNTCEYILWWIHGHFAGTPFIQPRLLTSEIQHGIKAHARAGSPQTPPTLAQPAYNNNNNNNNNDNNHNHNNDNNHYCISVHYEYRYC